jgi:hypothetical protein
VLGDRISFALVNVRRLADANRSLSGSRADKRVRGLIAETLPQCVGSQMSRGCR